MNSSETIVIDGQRVVCEYVKRAVIINPDTSGMVLDTAEILAAVSAARTASATLAATVEEWSAACSASDDLRTGKGPRTLARTVRALGDRVDSQSFDAGIARRSIEWAVRDANPGATQAQIMTACRAL